MITSFSSFPILHSARLQLRSVEIKDIAALSALRSHPDVNRFLERAPATNEDEAKEFILNRQNDFANNRSVYWAITLKYDDDLIGAIGLWGYDTEKSLVEIGYELHPSYQGKGLMKEAISTVASFALNDMLVNAITACVMQGNESSVKLLEKNNFLKDEKNEYRPDDLPEFYDVYFLKK